MIRILVVEDEPGIAFGLRSDLTLEGYAVEVAEDGETASRRAEESAFDLILLDINMPAMNGWEFLSRYNKSAKITGNASVIVMLSTTLNPDDKLLAEELPAVSGFESKPLTREKLDRIVSFYFNNKSSGDV